MKTTEVTATFVNGKPRIVKGIVVMKGEVCRLARIVPGSLMVSSAVLLSPAVAREVGPTLGVRAPASLLAELTSPRAAGRVGPLHALHGAVRGVQRPGLLQGLGTTREAREPTTPNWRRRQSCRRLLLFRAAPGRRGSVLPGRLVAHWASCRWSIIASHAQMHTAAMAMDTQATHKHE